eukprot:gnl/TRDRNA2_/TRDRNA2_168618_c0_seq1.p1 gnl/TRDRNA2_/TRDRNA2_168618_c0~~gnl/TRDRNA2_/TRDRNA2_168618_c0_seq1.p1  ORF type:complete len:512 (+),score=69.40 gnl/TRDRNA2_/TRDRNA2_168618_c0_seq1:52-1536(+)
MLPGPQAHIASSQGSAMRQSQSGAYGFSSFVPSAALSSSTTAMCQTDPELQSFSHGAPPPVSHGTSNMQQGLVSQHGRARAQCGTGFSSSETLLCEMTLEKAAHNEPNVLQHEVGARGATSSLQSRVVVATAQEAETREAWWWMPPCTVDTAEQQGSSVSEACGLQLDDAVARQRHPSLSSWPNMSGDHGSFTPPQVVVATSDQTASPCCSAVLAEFETSQDGSLRKRDPPNEGSATENSSLLDSTFVAANWPAIDITQTVEMPKVHGDDRSLWSNDDRLWDAVANLGRGVQAMQDVILAQRSLGHRLAERLTAVEAGLADMQTSQTTLRGDLQTALEDFRSRQTHAMHGAMLAAVDAASKTHCLDHPKLVACELRCDDAVAMVQELRADVQKLADYMEKMSVHIDNGFQSESIQVQNELVTREAVAKLSYSQARCLECEVVNEITTEARVSRASSVPGNVAQAGADCSRRVSHQAGEKTRNPPDGKFLRRFLV